MRNLFGNRARERAPGVLDAGRRSVAARRVRRCIRRALAGLALTLVLTSSASAATTPAAPAGGDSVKSTGEHGFDPSKGFPTPTPLVPQVFPVSKREVRPPGFRINGRQAVAIAKRQPAIKRLLERYPELVATPALSGLELSAGFFWHWSVGFQPPHGHDDLRQGEVEIGPTGQVFETTTGVDVGWPLEHGYSGVLGDKLNAPYIWLPMCLLFLLPFLDFRNPFRLLHLDLLVLLGFGASQFFFNLGKPWISVPLIYPALLYCAARMLLAAFRPRRRAGPLIPHLGNRVLVLMLVALLAFRGGLGIADSVGIDVAFAGVVGADRLAHGEELYVDNEFHPDTYGPVNYLAYVPFEAAFPYHGEANDLPAGIAATLGFDILTAGALFLLGRRLRRGPPGTRLGLALAVAWTAYPYTALVIMSQTNDALVPLLVILALVGASRAPLRGLWLALGTMVKFVPGLLVPPLAAGHKRLTLRSALAFGIPFAIAVAVVTIPFLPDGGLREFWNTTLGFQLGRTSPLSFWGRHPSITGLKTVVGVLTAALAVALAFWPRRRNTAQLAAICGAIIALAQTGTGYWLYFYIVWFAPLMLVSVFDEYSDLGGPQPTVTSDFVKPERMSQPVSVTTTRSSMRTPSDPGR